MDDTLFAERDYVLSGFRAAGAWLVRERGVAGFAEEAQRLFEAGRRGRIFNEALATLTESKTDSWVAELIAVYREHQPQLRLLPEAESFLIWARPRFRLALVSDGFLAVQQRKAHALGLAQWMDHLVFTDQWGRESWKPAQRGFEEVVRLNPGDAEGYVYVADNPRKDFIAPRALGWKTVRVRRSGGEHAAYEPTADEAADQEIDSLDALGALLKPCRP
ncbi:HAD family hydrolase [Horticoccus luteus]|uniref:HAD family hydrolase n=2 Tax=Horticoccus luteus TaxID=2862869 RepID=A0A8F9TTI7_9BACT|nr:HAD family hydrolase [Horticoccus luteus]QYM77508.1 HAD family hydrolase [Horticoccus luteus]